MWNTGGPPENGNPLSKENCRMKVENVIKKCIVFIIVPCFQRMLSLVDRMSTHLSQLLDGWAYSTAQRLAGDNAISCFNHKVSYKAQACRSGPAENDPLRKNHDGLRQVK